MNENIKIIKKLLIDKDMTFNDLVKLSPYTTAWGLRKAIKKGDERLIKDLKEKILQPD